METLWKDTVSAYFRGIRTKLCGNCAFPRNFHTRKLGEITIFFAVYSPGECMFKPTIKTQEQGVKYVHIKPQERRQWRIKVLKSPEGKKIKGFLKEIKNIIFWKKLSLLLYSQERICLRIGNSKNPEKNIFELFFTWKMLKLKMLKKLQIKESSKNHRHDNYDLYFWYQYQSSWSWRNLVCCKHQCMVRSFQQMDLILEPNS